MARAKGDKQQSDDTIDVAEGALIDVPLDQLTNPELTAIDAVLRQFGDQHSMMRVYREGPGGYRDIIFLYECAPSDWIGDGPARLQRDYGKGKYRLHLHNDAGQMVLNKGIQIEAAPRQPEKTTAAVPDVFAQALAGVSESMKLMAAAVAQIQHRDPLQGLTGLKEIAGIVKDMMPPVAVSAPASQSIESTLTLFRTIMDVSKSFAQPVVPRDGEGNVDLQGAALTKGLDLIAKLFEQNMQGGARPAVAALPSAPDVQVLTDEQIAEAKLPGADVGITESLEMQALKLHLRMANRAAAKNSPPDEYADGIVEMLPDDVFDMLEKDPKWFDYIVGLVPECGQFKSWYERLRVALLTYLEPEPQEPKNAPLTADGKGATVLGDGNPDAGTSSAGTPAKS